MKNTVTRLALASLLAMGLGSAHAYATSTGEDLNGDPAVALTLTSSSNSVSAATTFLDSFKGASVGVGTETFESQTVGATGPLTLNYPGTGGSLTATLAGGTGAVACVLCDANGDPNAPTELDPATGLPLGRYSVPVNPTDPTSTGKNYFNVVVPKSSGTTASTADFTVTFNQDIAAFGFYGIDIGDHGGTLSVQLLSADGTVLTNLSVGNDTSSLADGSVLFFSVMAGNASELFRSIRFITTGSKEDDGFAFDNFTIADACQAGIACGSTGGGGGGVPEPASLALVAGALLSLRLGSRRRA